MNRFLRAVEARTTKLPSAGVVREHHVAGRRLQELKLLSEGGFSFIYLVKDAATAEQFALKRVLCQDRSRLETAKREVQWLELFSENKNVVSYYGSTIENDTGSSAKVMLILLEYCDNGHLLDALNAYNGCLPESLLIAMICDICRALVPMHAHEPPIAHRDIKLENVLSSSGSWKVCDFGSCSSSTYDPTKRDKAAQRAIQDEIEGNTTMMYRSPEMVDMYRNFELNTKSDVWMLGCVIFSLAYSRHPFQDESSLAIANGRYQLPAGTVSRSEKLNDLIHWTLAFDPKDRPTVPVLLECLENIRKYSAIPLPRRVKEAKAQHDHRAAEKERSERVVQTNSDVAAIRQRELRQSAVESSTAVGDGRMRQGGKPRGNRSTSPVTNHKEQRHRPSRASKANRSTQQLANSSDDPFAAAATSAPDGKASPGSPDGDFFAASGAARIVDMPFQPCLYITSGHADSAATPLPGGTAAAALGAWSADFDTPSGAPSSTPVLYSTAAAYSDPHQPPQPQQGQGNNMLLSMSSGSDMCPTDGGGPYSASPTSSANKRKDTSTGGVGSLQDFTKVVIASKNEDRTGTGTPPSGGSFGLFRLSQPQPHSDSFNSPHCTGGWPVQCGGELGGTDGGGGSAAAVHHSNAVGSAAAVHHSNAVGSAAAANSSGGYGMGAAGSSAASALASNLFNNKHQSSTAVQPRSVSAFDVGGGSTAAARALGVGAMSSLLDAGLAVDETRPQEQQRDCTVPSGPQNHKILTHELRDTSTLGNSSSSSGAALGAQLFSATATAGVGAPPAPSALTLESNPLSWRL